MNSKDRWGSTPLNYADLNSTVSNYLIKMGGKFGNPNPIMVPRHGLVQASDNQYRLFFASYYGDLDMIDLLLKIDLKINL